MLRVGMNSMEMVELGDGFDCDVAIGVCGMGRLKGRTMVCCGDGAGCWNVRLFPIGVGIPFLPCHKVQ